MLNEKLKMSQYQSKESLNKKKDISSRPIIAAIILVGGAAALILTLVLSILLGVADIDFNTIWSALFNFNPDLMLHQVIFELRIPRALVGALVGAGFAVSGAIMQGMTRNPLAGPDIMGINAGAAFAISIAFAFLPGLPYTYLMLISFIGAALGAFMTYMIGSMAKGGLTPVRLALAGTIVGTLLSSIASGISIYYGTAQDVSFWFMGGIAGASWTSVYGLVVWIAAGLFVSMLISRSITVLSLGEETAVGLGINIVLVKTIGIVVAVVLAGAGVSAAGPIVFVGLMIPHIVRFLVGTDYRWIIPCSGIMGSVFLVFSDILARMVKPPYEAPIGVITALIGVPFFLYLARREGREI